MPKPITPRIHGMLDYSAVAGLLTAPWVYSLTGVPRTVAYVLGVAALALAVFTDSPLGVVKVLPLRVHAMVEVVTAPTLAALPWLLGFAGDVVARYVYIGAGIVLFSVWLLTDYEGDASARQNPRQRAA